MRLTLVCLLLSAPLGGISAHDELQLPLATGADLLEWCKLESEAAFVARGVTAYNWTARHVERGNMLGLICNWAGPGNSHVPQSYFQSQGATLTASATAWSLGTSKITYAPANSCSSTTTSYDQDGDGALSAGEGVGVLADLDTPSGSNTVAQELADRGFSIPGYY